MLACRNTNIDCTSGEKVIQFLIEFENLDVNKQNKDGWNALMVTSVFSKSESSLNVLSLLLKHPKIDPNLQNNGKITF
jgi:hypothetical protein